MSTPVRDHRAAPFIDDRVKTWLPEKGKLPVFISPQGGALATKAAFLDWVRAHEAKLDDLTITHGGIVLRGFPLVTPEDFNQFLALFPQFEAGYTGGGAARGRVVDRVMEATRAAKNVFLCLHQEMAYLRSWPDRLVFFCRKPAESGGETIIGDMREFTRRMPVQIRDQLEQRGLRGVRNFVPPGQGRGEVADARDGIAWDESFGTTDRKEVEALCAERGLEPVWRDDGGLVVITQLKAFTTHPITQDHVYHCFVHTNHRDPVSGKLTYKMDGPLATGYTYGDGSLMPLKDEQALLDLMDDVTVCWPWQAGDIMIVDNVLTAHGRNRYTGTRETLVGLLAR
jgi:alpha-ketoglutarate-dependent taurine dioxygenase